MHSVEKNQTHADKLRAHNPYTCWKNSEYKDEIDKRVWLLEPNVSFWVKSLDLKLIYNGNVLEKELCSTV